MELFEIPLEADGGPCRADLYQPIPEIAEIEELHGLMMVRRSHRFGVVLHSAPNPFSLGAEAVLELEIPWDTRWEPRHNPEYPFPAGFRRELVMALQPDFFPTWGPV